MADWFAVHTHENSEAFADLNLRRKSYETYFPWTHQWVPSAKSKILSDITRVACLTRYMFVKTIPENLADVKDTLGVSRVINPPGRYPVPIPLEVMDELMDRLGRTGKVYSHPAPKPGFEGVVGQQFRLGERSAFFGFIAEISKVIDNERILAKLQSALFGEVGREIEVSTADVLELPPVTAAKSG